MSDTLFPSPAFLNNAVIYEVNIRQYSPEGTFNAFAAHLPRLKELGAGILWLMPIHPIGVEKRKGTLGSYYSISDHKGINPEFGNADDLRSLVTNAHARGIKIIIDWVANHTAWDHVWTKTHPDFFVRNDKGDFTAPYDWDDVIQIDHSNSGEQAAMQDAMQYWIEEFDIDGFRADLAHLTPLQFWKDARLKLTSLKKDLVWLAETEGPGYHEAFDISYTWEWMHATEKFSKKEISLGDCIGVLKKYKTDFPAQAHRLFFTSNHDENSWNGTEFEKYGALAKPWAVFSFTYPGLPLIYSGQELPNRKRLKFFDKDLIEWNGDIQLQDFYKILSELRKRNKTIAAGAATELHFFEEFADKNILAYQLSAGEAGLLVFLNMGTEDVSQHIFSESIKGRFRDVFSGEEAELKNEYLFSAKGGEFKVLEKIVPTDLH